MKKIGIMTWYAYQNYGTALQAVALNLTVSNLGYEVYDIAYNPEIKGGRKRLNLSTRIINRIKGFYPFASKEKDIAFSSFIKANLPTTLPADSDLELIKLNKSFDAFICGSDQVWSPRCFDAHYYLDFVDDPKKKIAYGPSFGCDSITNFSIEEKIKKLLNDFSSISVREESGAHLIESLTGNRPILVVDPTLLLTSFQWKRMANSYDDVEEPYCLFYFLGGEKCNLSIAKKIAAARGLKILAIPVFEKQRGSSECVDACVGPAEFLTLIDNSSLVLTDSFHGLVFSALFNKEFVAFERFDPRSPDSQNTRIYNFLNMIKSRSALLSRDKLNDWPSFIQPSIDFCQITKCISQKRLSSIEYLKEALSKAVSKDC